MPKSLRQPIAFDNDDEEVAPDAGVESETARRENEAVAVVLERCSMFDMLKKLLCFALVLERLSCGAVEDEVAAKNSAGGQSGGEEGPRVA